MTSLLLVVLAIGTGIFAWRISASASEGVSPAANTSDSGPGEVEPVEMIPYEVWSVLRTTTNALPAGVDSTGRFRLAGTFFLMDSVGDDGEGERLAILDDVENDRQHIVSEGQNFDQYEIVRIQSERVILRRDGEEIELALSFSGDQQQADEGEPEEPGESPDAMAEPEEVVLETNRFGKRIGENRWVMQKEALRAYYTELINEPERAAAIYASMKPDRDEAGAIKGYRLQTEGEGDFFKAVGLLEGDKIRKVNSMNMTSQARAEYFISEFGQDRLGAVVLDIEREGAEQKLIYLFR